MKRSRLCTEEEAVSNETAHKRLKKALKDRDFILEFMRHAIVKMLKKFKHSSTDLRYISFHSTYNLEQKETVVKKSIDLVLKHIPKEVPSLSQLAAKKVKQNKPDLAAGLSKLPDSIFYAHPKLEVNPNRYLKRKIELFIKSYEADALELIVLLKFYQLMSDKKSLAQEVHSLLITTDVDNYPNYMKEKISSPILNLLQMLNNSEITEDDFHSPLRDILRNYEPMTAEGKHIHRLVAITHSEKVAVNLHALLSDKRLRAETSERLVRKLRQPLLALITDYNNFVKEKKSGFKTPRMQ